jgi:hypothetical protein
VAGAVIAHFIFFEANCQPFRRSTAARLMFWSMRILMLTWILWLGVGIILRTRGNTAEPLEYSLLTIFF